MTYLDQLLTRRRAEVNSRRMIRSLAQVRRDAAARPAPRNFVAALKGPEVAIVAEMKRASPSGGVIAAGFDPETIAREYEAGGAAALSVLTEPHAFGGSFADLRSARTVIGLPVLCKDFVIDEYQLWEAASAGADAVLLIAAALTDAQLEYFAAVAVSCAVTPLVEVHDEFEIARVVRLRSSNAVAPVIGINNRDLKTMTVNIETALRVRRFIPKAFVVVAESGYSRPEDLAAVAAVGIDAVLVGEALMRQSDRAAALRRLRGAAL